MNGESKSSSKDNKAHKAAIKAKAEAILGIKKDDKTEKPSEKSENSDSEKSNKNDENS